MIAGLKDIVNETNALRDDSNFENDFYLFDEMLKLDPELNGAVRAVSLTANNYTINWRSAKTHAYAMLCKSWLIGLTLMTF